MTAQISFSFEAIGTHWEIDVEKLKESKKQKLQEEIRGFIKQFDKEYSRFRSDSLVTKMACKKGIYKLPKNAKKMIDFYKKLYDLTNRKVTPLIGKMMEDAGYDATYSLVPKKLSHPPRWEDVMIYNYPNLKIKKPVLLDFGAAGKGYLVDLVGETLIKNNIHNFCIDAGGDIFCKNMKQKVGLEHPDNSSEVIGTVEINNECICGSAGNRRRWGKFNHIINPHTLKPIVDVKAVWVKSSETMIADGIATSLFFVNPEKLKKDFKFSYLIIYQDMTFKKSEDFKAELFIKNV